ncbi:ABC transporter permease [Nocardioides aestuarii]|uniref:ABC transporter permease n=1 Tax=Nocardioides aestuarii TaxID=252231 RepID=A0ABW4TKZ4_9ACTN
MLRLTLRNLLARKVRLAMSALAIVLGIGFLTGVMTFSTGLNSTFDNIFKGSTPQGVVQPSGTDPTQQFGIGDSNQLTPRDLRRLDALPEVAKADGQVNGFGLYVLDRDGKLVGAGSGAPTLSFNYTDTENILGEPSLTLVSGDWPESTTDVVLDTGAAERAGYEVGDEVTAIAPAGASADTVRTTLTLTGTAEFNGGGTAGATLVVFSTEGAQQVFLGGQDVFTGAALTAAPGVSQREMVAAARTVLPDGYEAVTGDQFAEDSSNAVGQFLDVISTFLITFAVIAILVGGFIIANTFNILVAQRVRELALLRAIGASTAQVRSSVLVEAAVMALVGSSLGIGVGLLLARALAALFSAIGLEIAGSALQLTPLAVVLAYVVGLLVTMTSAYLPARRASRTAPVAAMRDDVAAPAEGSLRRRGLIGAVVAVVGAGLAVVGLQDPPFLPGAAWIGAAAVLWILTAAALSPVVGHPVLVACRSLFGAVFGTTGRLAGENTLRNPRRTGSTASALMIGLALVSAVGTLAASMSATLDEIVDDQFSADFLVQSANFQTFPTGIGDDMEKVDGVATVSRDQYYPALVDGEQEFIAGLTSNFDEIYELEVVDGAATMSGRQALLSSDAAADYGVDVGDPLTLAFPGGREVEVEVAGTFEETPVVSTVNVPMEVLEEAGIKRTDTSVSINLEDGADKAAVQAELDEVVADVPIVSVQDKEAFADSLRGQINQLLYIIYGLLALAIVIAVIGIVNTLSLSVIERTREVGLLRAVGLSRGRLRLMVTLESVTISVMGAVLGMVVGLVIGVLLRQSLAEDLTSLAIPLSSLVVFLVISVVFGVVAAILPAVRAARMKVLDAIATE